MKSVLVVFSLLLLLTFFAGCGPKTTPTGTTPTTTGTTPTTTTTTPTNGGTTTTGTTPTTTSPAAFSVSNLTIDPTEAQIGKQIEISALVTNNGAVEGTYTATLKVNDVAQRKRDITLAPGKSGSVFFSISPSVIGTYQVDVDGLLGEFTLKQAEVLIPPPPEQKPVIGATPAKLTYSDFDVRPLLIHLGARVQTSVVITNSGGSDGVITLVFKVNDVEKESKQVMVRANWFETVYFSIQPTELGTYKASLEEVGGEFTNSRNFDVVP